MVIIHGAYLFNVTKCTGLTYENWTLQNLSGLRGFFSLCLPALAGFYLRGQVGPYLDIGKGKLPPKFIYLGFHFLFWAFLLEGLRVYLVTFKLSYFFFWEPLHFIALSMIVSYACLILEPRLMTLLPLLLFMGREFAFKFGRNFEIHSLSDTALQVMAVLWSLCLAVLFATTLRIKIAAKYKKIVPPLFFGICVIFAYRYIAGNTRTLLNFANLPLDILVPRIEGDNWWSFVGFFPIFTAGYFLRAIFTGQRSSLIASLVFSLSLFYSIYFWVFKLSKFRQALSNTTLYSKELFMMDNGTLVGVISLFFMTIFLIYFLLNFFKMRFLEKLAYWSRNIIVLYLMHGFIFMLFVRFFPFKPMFRMIPDSTSFLSHEHFVPFLVYYMILHLVYFLSLYLSHRATLWIDRSRLFSVVN